MQIDRGINRNGLKRYKKSAVGNTLWSIRMRASKSVKRGALSVKNKKTKLSEIHISGAEGLYGFGEIDDISRDYFLRAMNHAKGMPDKIVITVEKIKRRPILAPLLPVSTARCISPEEAGRIIRRLLSDSGISKKAIGNGTRVVKSGAAMHGASLIRAESGIRAEPDRKRGVRVSRLGIERDGERGLSRKLARDDINTATVKEAITLASKVASCKGVVAELCVSDDPDYTTGYVASRDLGYVRITNIKRRGSLSGGRVFFVEEKANVTDIIEYLERTPVIVHWLESRFLQSV